MNSFSKEISIKTPGQGLHEITELIFPILRQSNVKNGLCTIFIKHTSASLTIQENADPSARADLERWLNRLVPEKDRLYTHTAEGPDDMPSHIKAVLTVTSLSIPVIDYNLSLGTWQGIYLWEHRTSGHIRKIAVNIIGEVE